MVEMIEEASNISLGHLSPDPPIIMVPVGVA